MTFNSVPDTHSPYRSAIIATVRVVCREWDDVVCLFDTVDLEVIREIGCDRSLCEHYDISSVL